MHRSLYTTKRQHAVDDALGSQRIEGVSPSPDVLRDAERWVKGELTIDQALTNVLARYRGREQVRRR